MITEVLQQGLIAFFAAVGIAWFVWTAVGVIFLSKRERTEKCVVLIPVTDDAPALEQTVAGLQWTAVYGRRFDRILIADCGLDEETKERARRLSRQNGAVRLCRVEDVPEHVFAAE